LDPSRDGDSTTALGSLVHLWYNRQIWVENKARKLDVSAKAVMKKGLGMSLGYILQRYEWDSSQAVELLFHAGTNKSIEQFEINYLCGRTGNKYILRWNFVFWSVMR